MGQIILANAVVRKPGYMYYVDGEGSVCEAKMNHSGRPKKKKEVVEKKAPRKLIE